MNKGNTKLAIIGTVGVPAKYGGFETLAHHLVLNLSAKLDITVYNSEKNYAPNERKEHWNGATIKYLPFSANGAQSIIYDIVSMVHAAIYSDVLLVLGVSGCLFLPFIKLFTNKKVIVNIDGLEWRRNKWGTFAKKFLKLSERFATKYADEIITDNAAIQDYAEIEYGIKTNLIEYGADHNKKVTINDSATEKYDFLKTNYAFKVCRIEPENNVDVVLEAFKQVVDQRLVIVGNWEASDYGQQLRKRYQQCDNIILLDPIYEKTELNLLRSNAALYIHGHSAGGTNPSLVEAMYLGLPVVAFDVVYNRITTENRALFFDDSDSLVRTLQQIEHFKPVRIAKALKAVADRRYTWEIITAKYLGLTQNVSEQIFTNEQAPIIRTLPKVAKRAASTSSNKVLAQ